MEYSRLQVKKHPVPGKPRQSGEARYWKAFRSPVYLKSHGPVDCVHISPTEPHRYAVTSGARVLVYSPKTAKVVKTITRFKTNARSAHFRHDGKLLVAGDDDGTVQVFDLNSRAVLRTFKEHKQPVRTSLFSPPTANSILTTGDDTTVRLFDVPSGQQTSLFTSHVDYVRSGAFVPSNPALTMSGSYDGTVKLWDSRVSENDGEVMSLTHDFPVEDVIVHPSGTMAVSAGGPLIRIWDLVSGTARCLKAFSNHQKTVTRLAWDGQSRRLLSAGLDGLVKVYDAAGGTWRVGHTMRYGTPLTALAISPSDSHIIVGTAESTVCVRQRQSSDREAPARQGRASTAAPLFSPSGAAASAQVHTGAAAQQYTLGRDSVQVLPNGDIEVRSRKRKRKKMQPWDRLLKSFRYGDALDSVLNQPGIEPNLVYSMLLELAHRDGIHQALLNRDDISLAPLLRYMLKHCTDPRYTVTICDVLQITISMYSSVLGQSPLVDDLFNRLKRRLDDELAFQEDLWQLQGSLDMLLISTSLR